MKGEFVPRKKNESSVRLDARFDCRYYSGYKPCGRNPNCDMRCHAYEPRGTRILIIKLAAMGDVLRTTPVAEALRKHYHYCHITWITDPESEPLLRYNPAIDRLLTWSPDSCLILQAEKFDLVLNFEKEMRALALDTLTQSRTKRGFALHPGAGTLVIHNAASEYALRLGIDDDLKFRQNTKTMPRILFEMAELPYEGEEYVLQIGRGSVAFAERFREKAGLKTDERVIGLNTGCGAVFPTKQWPLENCVELIGLLRRETTARVLLLGGVREREFNAAILEKAPRGSVTDTGTENSLEEFIGLMELCDVVVSADSLAMHLAIGRRKPVIALIGPTSAAEIEVYGRGGKIVSPAPCAPCYRTSCDKTPSCMCLISARQVLEAVLKWL